MMRSTSPSPTHPRHDIPERQGDRVDRFRRTGALVAAAVILASTFLSVPLVGGLASAQTSPFPAGGAAGSPATSAATLAVNFTLSPYRLDVGQMTTLHANVTGGASPYTFTWSGLPAGCASVNVATLNCTPSSAGLYSLHVNVTDATGLGGTGNNSLIVNADPAIVSFLASPNPVNVAASTTITFNYSAGTTPDTFRYAGLPPGCSSQNTSSLSCTPAAAGTYTVTGDLSDSTNYTVSAALSLTVQAANGTSNLTLQSFLATPGTVGIGNTTYLNISVTGGTLPYTYLWGGLPPGCTSANTSSLACVPTAIGRYSPGVTVTDSRGGSLSSTTALIVTNSTTSAPLTIVSFYANPNPVKVGTSTFLNASVTGGATPYGFTYIGLPTGCVTANSTVLPCVPTVTGNFTIRVYVVDSFGQGASTQLILVVSLNGSSPLAVALQVTPGTITLGAAATLTSAVTGGMAPFTFRYQQLPAGCSSQNLSSLSCTPNVAGTFVIGVRVTDALLSLASASTTLVVQTKNGTVAPLGIEITASPLSGVAPLTVSFAATVAGGVAPYAIAWTFGDGASGSGYAVQHAYLTAGSYSVAAVVTDAARTQATASLAVSVSANSTSGTGPLSVALSASPVQGPAPLVVTFDAAASGGSAPYAYAWAFGDGSNASGGATIQHTYTAVGVYTSWVYVSDSAGSAVVAGTVVNVTNSGASNGTGTLHLSVSIHNVLGSAPLKTAFTVQVSGGHGPYTLVWNWQDGSPTQTVTTTGTSTVTHTYTRSGVFHPDVTARDSQGHQTSWDQGTAAQSTPLVKVLSSSVGSTGFPWWIVLLVAAVAGILLVVLLAGSRRKRTRGRQTLMAAENPARPAPPAPEPPKLPVPGNGAPSGQDPLGYSW